MCTVDVEGGNRRLGSKYFKGVGGHEFRKDWVSSLNLYPKLNLKNSIDRFNLRSLERRLIIRVARVIAQS